MGFWTLMEGFLLFANALAILNEDRFLSPRGWTMAEMPGGGRKSLKGQFIGLIHACQYMRLPLMILNIITIVVKLFSGWDWKERLYIYVCTLLNSVMFHYFSESLRMKHAIWRIFFQNHWCIFFSDSTCFEDYGCCWHPIIFFVLICLIIHITEV